VLSLAMPEITYVDMKFIAGATRIINQADYAFILLSHTDRDPEILTRFANSGLVDGFILMEVYLHDERVDALKNARIPFVLVGRCEDNTGLTYVDQDFEHVMEQCVTHLVEEGHRSIAFLHSEDSKYGFTVRTLREFRSACQRHGLKPITNPCKFSPEDGKSVMGALLDQHHEITAAIIGSDIPALGAVEAVEERGLKVPDTFSMISQEHSVISTLSSFAPSVIDIRADELTSQAALMLIDILEGRTVAQPQLLVQPRLIFNKG
jgi:DNA-binding LacI/PurR family transcriptional regulator